MASVIIQKLFKVYQKRRILVFLNPDLDPQGSGYNIIQSKIAIGSGGFFGKGFLKGSQSQLGFLPEKSSDFIFSVVAEEWGFFGAIILLGLFGFIIFRCIQTAFESKDKFGALLASGITTIFFFHILINIGMVVGIMPVTGLPALLRFLRRIEPDHVHDLHRHHAEHPRAEVRLLTDDAANGCDSTMAHLIRGRDCDSPPVLLFPCGR